MEVLRRDTLEWEKITLKGKNNYNYLTLSNGDKINTKTILATRGKINFGKLGYCTCCGKIMTKKEFDKHSDVKASYDKCMNCYNMSQKDYKIHQDKEKTFIKSGKMFCNRCNEYINNDTKCMKFSCHGEFCTSFFKPQIYLPSKILTIKKFVKLKWELSSITNYYFCDNITLKHPTYNIKAHFDENGYLSYLGYKGKKCYYDEKTDSLRGIENNSIITDSQVILRAIRRLYK